MPESKVRDVGVCELLNNPKAFNGQLVRFRGRLAFEFEGDTVDDNDCGVPLWHPGIWWIYGGDYLPPRQIKKIAPQLSAILRDSSFQTFEERAHLRRAELPDRQPCEFRKECNYYDVVATFTGKFFAKELSQQAGPRGYGHMSCCHLIVIDKISEVAFQRTPVPRDDQVFSCTSITWQSDYPATPVSSIDERVNRNRQFMMDQARSRGDGLLADKMQNSPPWHFVGLMGSLVWSSPDLLTTYTAKFPEQSRTLRKKHHKQIEPPSPGPMLMNISREQCEPVAN